MSTFSDTAAGGRRASKAAERCNLISQFLKEKRSSGALSLGMCGKMEPRAATMDLLTNLEKSDDSSKQNASAMEFPPHFMENQSDFRSLARAEPNTPQMAIFYAGKVLVFDTFPPEKATEIMELATKLSSNNSGVSKTPSIDPVASENLNRVSQTTTPPRSHAVGSDMRYPRRASLLKFLEKRKERVIARGPYQQMNLKPEGDSSGDDLEVQSCKPFDLNI